MAWSAPFIQNVMQPIRHRKQNDIDQENDQLENAPDRISYCALQRLGGATHSVTRAPVTIRRQFGRERLGLMSPYAPDIGTGASSESRLLRGLCHNWKKGRFLDLEERSMLPVDPSLSARSNKGWPTGQAPDDVSSSSLLLSCECGSIGFSSLFIA